MLVDHFNGTPLECVFSIYGNAALLATALKHPAMHSLLELNQRYLEIAILFF